MLNIATVLVILFVAWGITLCVWAFFKFKNFQLTHQLHYEEFRAQRALKNIRETFEMFGFDMSDISDEQLQEGIIKFSKNVATYGVTAKELVEHLQKLHAGFPSYVSRT